MSTWSKWGVGINEQILDNPRNTSPGSVCTPQVPSPDTSCDEVHLVSTRYNETIQPGSVVFAGAGVQALFQAQGNLQIFEVDFQFSAGVTVQLFEGNPTTGGTPISGLWTFAAGQFWTWGGKYTKQNLYLQVNGAVTVQFEARYRIYQ